MDCLAQFFLRERPDYLAALGNVNRVFQMSCTNSLFGPYRRFKLHKRSQLFIRSHNETLSVHDAMYCSTTSFTVAHFYHCKPATLNVNTVSPSPCIGTRICTTCALRSAAMKPCGLIFSQLPDDCMNTIKPSR